MDLLKKFGLNLAKVITLDKGIAQNAHSLRDMIGPFICMLLYCLVVRVSNAGSVINVFITWIIGSLILRLLIKNINGHGASNSISRLYIFCILGYSSVPLIILSPILFYTEATADSSLKMSIIAWITRVIGILWSSAAASISITGLHANTTQRQIAQNDDHALPTVRPDQQMQMQQKNNKFLVFWPVCILHIFLLSLRSAVIIESRQISIT